MRMLKIWLNLSIIFMIYLSILSVYIGNSNHLYIYIGLGGLLTYILYLEETVSHRQNH